MSSVELLLRRCCFHGEWSNPCGLDQRGFCDMHELVRSGRATMTVEQLDGALFSENNQSSSSNSSRSFVSIAVKEKFQRDVSKLPIGARSLLLDCMGGLGNDDRDDATAAAAVGFIALRGVNKFDSVREVGSRLVLDALTELDEKYCTSGLVDDAAASSSITLQRKEAGFVVHVFSSVEGDAVHVMSKHSVNGPHAEAAKEVLRATLLRAADGDHRRAEALERQLAQKLHALGATLSGECVCPSWDISHPILEDQPIESSTDGEIFFFSLHSSTSIAEVSFPFGEVVQLCSELALQCVPHVVLRGGSSSFSSSSRPAVHSASLPIRSIRGYINQLLSDVCAWDHRPFGSAQGGEGYVLVLEIPITVCLATFRGAAAAAAVASTSGSPGRVVALRLKVKTLRYEVLRRIRARFETYRSIHSSRGEMVTTTTSGASQEVTEHHDSDGDDDRGAVDAAAGASSPQTLYESVFIQWAQMHFTSSFAVCRNIMKCGIGAICSEFDAYCTRAVTGKKMKSGSGGSNGPDDRIDFASLCAETSLQSLRNHVLVVMCGLPGSGKSSICHSLIQRICGSKSSNITPFRSVSCLSRDDISAAMEAQLRSTTADGNVSAHALRWLRKGVHFALLEQLSAVARCSFGPALVLLDACNAEPRGRLAWISAFAPAAAVIVCNLVCDDHGELAKRVMSRTDHPTLNSDSETQVQSAIFAVAQKLNFSTVEELRECPCGRVINIDVAQCSSEDAAAQLHSVIDSVCSEDAAMRCCTTSDDAPAATLIAPADVTVLYQSRVEKYCEAFSLPVPSRPAGATATATAGAAPRRVMSAPTHLLARPLGGSCEASKWMRSVDDVVDGIAGFLMGHAAEWVDADGTLRPVEEHRDDHHALSAPSLPRAAGATTVMDRVVSRVASLLHIASTTAEEPTNVSHRLRLVRGSCVWLLCLILNDRRMMSQAADGTYRRINPAPITHSILTDALSQRYHIDHHRQNLHFTLWHSTGSRSVSCSALPRLQSHLRELFGGDCRRVAATVAGVLMDGRAVALHITKIQFLRDDGTAASTEISHGEWASIVAAAATDGSTGAAFHITLGVTEGTKNMYSGAMFSQVDSWARHNECVKSFKSSRGKRPRAMVEGDNDCDAPLISSSSSRYFNYAQFEFDPAVRLEGTISIAT